MNNNIKLNEEQIKVLSDRHAFNCDDRYKSSNIEICENDIIVCKICGYPLIKLNNNGMIDFD